MTPHSTACSGSTRLACGPHLERPGESFRRAWLRGTGRGGPDQLADPSERFCRPPRMARLEAALFVADGALSARRLAQLAILADTGEARALIDELNQLYDEQQSAFRIERVATGYQLLTRPRLSFWLSKLHHRQADLKLTPPALETLTVIAYRQPVTRADIEAIRRVQCTELLKQLMDRGLVRIAGEDDSLGRPYLYETTRKFLETFGLTSLDDMPMADQLRKRGPKPEPIAESSPEQADPPSEERRVA